MTITREWDLIEAQKLLNAGLTQAAIARAIEAKAGNVHQAIKRGLLKRSVVHQAEPKPTPVDHAAVALLDTRGDELRLMEWRAIHGRKTPRAYTMQEVRALYQGAVK
jgi:hypothetical protein